ncbi:MAG: ATP-binding cassette domain-containing protein [Acidimicrobiia bacterium]|nr:ATP-binding cassette domain-containing protein [Acidimicrobiia bacterium]
MSLEADVAVHQGHFELRAALHAEQPRVVGVVGPSGAGKSTLLAVLAGLRRVDEGTVRLGGVPLDDGRRTFVSPEGRAVGMVFQEHLLFPHLDAAANVAFGLRARGWARRDAQREATAWLARVGLGHRATARPSSLSGGEARARRAGTGTRLVAPAPAPGRAAGRPGRRQRDDSVGSWPATCVPSRGSRSS